VCYLLGLFKLLGHSFRIVDYIFKHGEIGLGKGLDCCVVSIVDEAREERPDTK
jgi:hypothetical protein